ncbi:MarR family transcriptional regulator [Cryptosporangium phraense]|uniref:MarR family transcriptional regulator n=1 Tax=Cryptosporangium phraense TaxID=2593070 RepID=A0A545AI22_9ACTN|nr:MarR family transcriptional regulator [Cryptosporangium phraense]TQS40962.1 MarR family transcriptional regulator [Cryptosporangium phraense]
MERPIGYWVKSVDRLIDESFDRALGARGVGRRHWQVLNLLAEAPRSEDALEASLAPFGLGSALADLTRLGWVQGSYALTTLGEDALAGLREEVGALRRRTTDGLSDDDYRTTVATLQRITENLSA